MMTVIRVVAVASATVSGYCDGRSYQKSGNEWIRILVFWWNSIVIHTELVAPQCDIWHRIPGIWYYLRQGIIEGENLMPDFSAFELIELIGAIDYSLDHEVGNRRTLLNAKNKVNALLDELRIR